MHPSLARTDHRPWPLPASPWISRQSWLDLFFLHWPVPTAAVRALVPKELEIQEFEGRTWVSVVPFRIADLSLRFMPAIPGISFFPEMNLRLYVEKDGKAGVWFLSLDAGNILAVKAARWLFYLPYFLARFNIRAGENSFSYSSHRLSQPRADFSAHLSYSPGVTEPVPGTLTHWLSERYCLYSRAADGTLYRGEIHHLPWALEEARAEISVNELGAAHGLDLSAPPALVQFSKRQDVIFWPFEKLLST